MPWHGRWLEMSWSCKNVITSKMVGETCIILRKLLACLIFLVHLGCYGTNMNQLPRYLAFHSTIEIQVALHCHHVDERIKLRTIALAKYQWRIVFGLWFSKSRKSKHHPIIPTGIPAFTKKLHKLHGENPWLSVSFKNLRYRWDVVHGWFPPPCQFLSPFGPPQWLLSIYQYWMNYIGSTSLCFINLHTEVYKRN